MSGNSVKPKNTEAFWKRQKGLHCSVVLENLISVALFWGIFFFILYCYFIFVKLFFYFFIFYFFAVTYTIHMIWIVNPDCTKTHKIFLCIYFANQMK
jgi:hypothetical protein